MPDAVAVAAGKRSLREQLLAGRRARSQSDRAAARTAIADHLRSRLLACTVVCTYLPLATEPLLPALLDQLHAAGVRVLVPSVAADAPLDWIEYPAQTIPGTFGIAEPTGLRLGPDAIAGADVVLVPALAVDAAGHRLGRGGGHYDRSLALWSTDMSATAKGRPELIAVLFDGELLESVPFDHHDVPVDAVVTPTGGLHCLAR
jgi:5-formyltetrahydrofolate cyclo-ligase